MTNKDKNMGILESLYNGIKPILPMAGALFGTILVVIIARMITARKSGEKSKNSVRRQVITIILSLVGLLIIILVSPLDGTRQGQLLSLIGILFSAAIALSSTTLIGNAMAGMMLRAVRSFKPGDWVRVGEQFGRVTERGLFHIEIQTEDRDLTTLPNLYLVTNPVKVIRSSGTVVTAEVSLGYDVPYTKIKGLLLKAAEKAKLKEPFVHVINLGDFSVTYRTAGLLEEVKHLLSAQTKLKEAILDALHDGGVEIVSPTFMNTRAIPIERRFVPDLHVSPDKPSSDSAPEAMLFDKAEQAESLEKLRERYDALEKEIETARKDTPDAVFDPEKEELSDLVERLKKRQKWLAELIKHRENEDNTE